MVADYRALCDCDEKSDGESGYRLSGYIVQYKLQHVQDVHQYEYIESIVTPLSKSFLYSMSFS